MCLFTAAATMVGLLPACGGCDTGVDAPDGGAPTPACTSNCDVGDACDDDAMCASGHCVDSVCVVCVDDDACAGAEVCVDHVCQAPTCPVSTRCGAGGTCCEGDDECVSGTCLSPCEHTRCGSALELCCGEGELCYGFTCAAPGEVCTQATDCDDGEICEQDLGICLPEEAVGDCVYIPPPGAFEPTIECRWEVDNTLPDANRGDVVMAPVVGNLSDDNGDGVTDRFDVPDVVFASYDLDGDGCCNRPGTLRIVSGSCDGDNATTLANLSEPRIDNSGGIALGDLDGDGVMEIVAVTLKDDANQAEGTVAFKRDSVDGTQWSVLWRNATHPTWNVHTRGGAQPVLADLEGDGTVEVIVGNVVLEGATGALRFDGAVTSSGNGGIGNNAFLGPVSIAADLDLDGVMEVLAGNTAYSPTGEVLWTYAFGSDGSGCGGQLPCDGYGAAANLDDDPEGELVLVRQGEVFIVNHDGSHVETVTLPVDDCANNESGPPTVADFDGDGRAEIGTASGDYYVVVDLDCVSNGALPDGCSDPGVLWTVPNEDCTSRVTASSVFDFEGDGQAEVIYADETSFRILAGPDGAELFRDNSHGSHTRLEMAVIADVDNDGNAEVVIAENGSNNGTPGVDIWGDALDNWVFTRRIWNQHAYHTDNVTEEGGITRAVDQSWATPESNNYRQNVQGEGVFRAPDVLIVDVTFNCVAFISAALQFDVMNQGSRMVPAGTAASVHLDTGAEVLFVAEVRTTDNLFPGEREAFTVDVDVPDDVVLSGFTLTIAADQDELGAQQHNECIEDNNVFSVEGSCFISE